MLQLDEFTTNYKLNCSYLFFVSPLDELATNFKSEKKVKQTMKYKLKTHQGISQQHNTITNNNTIPIYSSSPKDILVTLELHLLFTHYILCSINKIFYY